MGDESWIPLESTEGADDWDMFEPKPRTIAPPQHAGKKRKRDFENGISQNGINGHDYAASPETQDAQSAHIEIHDQPPAKKLSNADSENGPVTEEPFEQEEDPSEDQPTTNGVHNSNDAPASKGNMPGEEDNLDEAQQEPPKPDAEMDDHEQSEEGISEDDAQPQPTRRITRALAAENNTSNTASPPLSPNSTVSSIDSSLLRPDPLFLLPPMLAASHRAPRSLLRLGIPVDELMETRRLLTMYIQKQEESVRGYEAVLSKLIKGKRMRDKVWQWAKAEGHVGELSDGEDWIDAEAWGLQLEDLKKGTDEENNEAQEDTGRGKGKRRRRD